MSTWRVAHALEQLRSEVNTRWPHRSKISDGTIGDTRHQHEAGGSDHNPNAAGVVRAFDCTANVGDTNPANVDGEWLFQHVISLGRTGHPALQNHGYVIFNHRAAYASNGWQVVAYHGVSPHTEHVHISVGRAPAQYDAVTSWNIVNPPGINGFRLAMINLVRHSLGEVQADAAHYTDAIRDFQNDYDRIFKLTLGRAGYLVPDGKAGQQTDDAIGFCVHHLAGK